MDSTISSLSSLGVTFAAGIFVALRSSAAPPAQKPQNRASAASAPVKKSQNARYPSPSAPPMNEYSALASANSRYTKNYGGGSNRRVTFASSPPSARGSKK